MVSPDPGIANLQKVDHVVVVMLENRSFDHMLGYLSLTGGRADVDGLQPDLANEYKNHVYPVHHLTTTRVDDDPDHSASAVDVQLDGGQMDGFVASMAASLADGGDSAGDPSPVMGYYEAAEVPVYDHLVEEFLVCDRWFSSVPGATWPNRLYSLCGRAAGSRDDLPPHRPPLYDQPSFARHLDAHGVSWRWYCFDTPTLRLADAHYTAGHHRRFGYFSTTGLTWKTRSEIRVDARAASFLEDAAKGTLPSVSWIDPAFTSFNPLGFNPNDDHAPADISDGQDFVLAIYDALASGPGWDRSLLIIVYDEHGGFYDHVPPPEAPDDNPGMFGRYGVRVPAIIVSPWVEPRSVSSTIFDHTSIIKSILLRFCPGALENPPDSGKRLARARAGRPQYVGARVTHAAHLGHLLTRGAPRPAPRRHSLIKDAVTRGAGRENDGGHNRQPGAGTVPRTDLQWAFHAAADELGSRGHPAGMP